jgi:acyl-coenzyme A thioesterase PaaI-like protein
MSEPLSLAGALERALAEAAGGDGRAVAPLSFTLDYGAAGDPARATVRARVDRATRSLVFVHGEAVFDDGRCAASASGVFRVAAT